jgi:hypothetical protein
LEKNAGLTKSGADSARLQALTEILRRPAVWFFGRELSRWLRMRAATSNQLLGGQLIWTSMGRSLSHIDSVSIFVIIDACLAPVIVLRTRLTKRQFLLSDLNFLATKCRPAMIYNSFGQIFAGPSKHWIKIEGNRKSQKKLDQESKQAKANFAWKLCVGFA